MGALPNQLELRVLIVDHDKEEAAETANAAATLAPDVHVVAAVPDAQRAIDAIRLLDPGFVLADAASVGDIRQFSSAVLSASPQTVIAFYADDQLFGEVAELGRSKAVKMLFASPKPFRDYVDSIRDSGGIAALPRQQVKKNAETEGDSAPIQETKKAKVVQFGDLLQRQAPQPQPMEGPYRPVSAPRAPYAPFQPVAETPSYKTPAPFAPPAFDLQRASAGYTTPPQAGYLSAAAMPHLQSHVITIFSPKGGVGKTMLAVNLAAATARAHPQWRVTLADFDTRFGGVAALLMLRTQGVCTVAEFPDQIAQVKARGEDVSQLLTPVRLAEDSGFFVLPGLRNPLMANEVDQATAASVINDLRQISNIVIIDAGDVIGPMSLAAITQADRVLLLTTPERDSTARLGRFVRAVFEQQDHELAEKMSQAVVITTMVPPGSPKKQHVSNQEIEKISGVQVTASIPLDPAVSASELSGKPVIDIAPKSQAAKAVVSLEQMLFPQEQQLAPAKGQKGGGLFSNLFNRKKKGREQSENALASWYED